MDLIRSIRTSPAHLLRLCLETYEFRRIAELFMAPAFFSPQRPHYAQLTDNFREKHGEIRIVGFPKSGNVWITSLIASCLDIDVNEKKRACRVTHTHREFHNKDLFNKKLLRGAFLIRDLRDVLVSLYHYTKTDVFIKHHGPHHIYDCFSDMYTDYFLPYFVNRINILETLPDSYVKFGWPVIRYERFWETPVPELKRLFQIWNIEVDDKKIEQAVENNSLDAMRQGKGKTTGEYGKTHFRKGGHGNYVNEIPPHILKDIEHRFGDYLRRWGYII